MKLSLSIGFLAIASVNAFAPTSFGVRSSTQLYSVGRVDTSEAIKAALAASKEFGATSPEARMAWEAVEEMDSADTRYDILLPNFCCLLTWPFSNNTLHSREIISQ